MNKRSGPGRPKGRQKDSRLNVMLPSNIKKEFQEITKKMEQIFRLKLVN